MRVKTIREFCFLISPQLTAYVVGEKHKRQKAKEQILRRCFPSSVSTVILKNLEKQKDKGYRERPGISLGAEISLLASDVICSLKF